MLSEAAFEELVADLARVNRISVSQAEEYLALTGDTPELDESERVIVRDKQGAEIARLVWPVE